MKAQEFCYWLQGFFELSCHDGPLTNAKLACIEKRLALVSLADPEHESVFVSWINVYLKGKSSLTVSQVSRVRVLLNSEFKHVIDGSYGVESAEAQKIHDGPDAWPHEPQLRC